MWTVLLLSALIGSDVAPAEAPLPICDFEVRADYPHDPQAFTQGLLFRDGHLFESTGLEGRSTVRMVRLRDGVVLKQAVLPETLFGEGLVDWKDSLLSVTWRSGIGFRWDRKTLEKTGQFSYRGEGWGLTRDEKNLILSDGTSTLRFLDPETLQETRRVSVRVSGRPLTNLNELEWVKGEVFANVWMTNQIVRIDPENGSVKSVIDLSRLKDSVNVTDPNAVLNGIAYDEKGDRLFVTGKNWPRLFEIRLSSC